ncbi:MAG: hypothetical protein AB1553_09765 [Nitrospirota bacterium]
MMIGKQLLSFLLSLRTAIWLLCLLIIMLFAGAVIMPSHQEFQSIHAMPLFEWMNVQASGITWWLWASVIILVLLSANTLFCSIESIIKKRKATQWLLLISPQIVHIGFIFILLAHLLSSLEGFKGNAVAQEGTALEIAGSTVMRIKSIDLQIDPRGYLTGWSVDVEYLADGAVMQQDRLLPNKPSLYKGFNIHVKDLQAYPFKAILLEVSREPGALWALAGGIIFMAGTITLIVLKSRRSERLSEYI